MSFSNHIKNIAMIGVTGHIGSFIVPELQKKGTFNITAITREGSEAEIPEGLKVAKVNYDDPSTLVKAFQGQDAVVVSLSVMAPPDTSAKVIRAAAEAKVPWIIPNEWGVGGSNEQAGKDAIIGPALRKNRQLVEELGVSSWVVVSCGFWYEWSLCWNPIMFGFDVKNKVATFYSGGNARMNVSTWPQTGLATAELLSLPITSEDGSACLSDYKNKSCFITSFNLSQREMLASLQRVTNTTDKDWTINDEDVKQRWEDGHKTLKEGNRAGFGKLLYARMFFPDEPANFEKHEKLSNNVLHLPKEDLDEATKRAIHRAETVPAMS